jgi:sterol 14-demethylase
MAILDLLGSLSPFGESPLVFFATWAAVFYAWHIVSQLLPADSDKPPMVFHLVPFLGSTLSYGMRPYEFFAEQRAKHGDVFTFVLLGRKVTVFLGPDGNDFVFNGKQAYINAEDAYTPLTTPVFGKEVVYDVPNHVLMEQKKFVKFGMSTDNFKQYVDMIVEETIRYLQSPVFGLDKKKGVTSLNKATPELTIFTASRTLQGQEVRDGFDASFADLYHDLDKGFTPINFFAPWLPLPANRKRDAAQRKMAEVYSSIVQKRRESGEDPAQDMIWNLMNQQYKDGRPLNDTEIAGIMIALLMAGQHTSAATSAWILLHLADKPELIEQLYEEQKRVAGTSNGKINPLKYEHLKDMDLLNYCIRETLRMHPPLHSLMRKVVQDLPVPNTKWHVPRGWYVLAAPGASAMDPQYFPNPDDFDPMRWAKRASDEDTEKIDYGYGLVSKGAASPYLPFGAGRHRCIGEQFAYLQLGTIVATFVRELQFKLPPGHSIADKDYTSMVVLPKDPASIAWQVRVDK